MNPLEKALQEAKQQEKKEQQQETLQNENQNKETQIETTQNALPKKPKSPLDMIFDEEPQEEIKAEIQNVVPKKAINPLDMLFEDFKDDEQEAQKQEVQKEQEVKQEKKEQQPTSFTNPLDRNDAFSEEEMNQLREELENLHKQNEPKEEKIEEVKENIELEIESEYVSEEEIESDFFKNIEFSEDLPKPKIHLNGFAKKSNDDTKEEKQTEVEENQEKTPAITNETENDLSLPSLEDKINSIQKELEMETDLFEIKHLKDSIEEQEMQQKHTTNQQIEELPTNVINDVEQQIAVEAILKQEIEDEKIIVSQEEKTEIRKSYSEEEMIFDRTDISDEQLIHLYKSLLMPRLIEDRMLIALRQGKISKWFSGYGQEAISVGIAEAIQTDEYLLPLHRNLGLFTSRKIELKKLFAQFQGKKEGFTKGRDRSFHFGTNEHHIVGMISHLGPQLTVANGIALADVLENKKRVTVTFTGDGGTSQGDFHEALNVAAVWDLPTIFVVENNGYGLSTPSHEQFRCKQFIDKGIGYGMKAVQVDGNNILEVYSTVKKLAEEMRENPRPVLLEMITFRMRGHEEASGTKYVPKELFEVWEKKDPVINYEKFLVENTILTEKETKEIREGFFENIKNALDKALELPKIVPNTEEEVADMYAPHEQELIAPISSNQTQKRLIDAISDSLRQSMERYPKMTIMGQDVADYGGVFKITDGFVEQFGKERVRNTPLCESAIVGASLGLSIRGWKAVMEMQFADFVTCGFNQIINNLAKSHYRWGQNADVVVRMPTGAGVAAGPFHSQSNEAWFAHTPGLKVVYPSSPYDAKGLLNASIEDPNPVIFFEHKALYRAISEDIYDDYYTLPIGKAATILEGEDVSIITYGMGVHWAKKAAQELNEELGDSHSLEILDLRTLLPWDKEAVSETVKKTGKVIILHEDCLTGGIGGEISAWIAEHHFTNLDAPIMREGSLDTAVPFSADLEKNFLPYERFVEKLKKLLLY